MTGRARLTTLSACTSGKGRPYLSGYLGKAGVVAFEGEADKFGNPTWDIFLAEPEPRDSAVAERQRARHAAKQVRRVPKCLRATAPVLAASTGPRAAKAFAPGKTASPTRFSPTTATTHTRSQIPFRSDRGEKLVAKRRGGSLPRNMPTKLSTLGRLAAAGKGEPAHPLSGAGRVWLVTPTYNEQLIAPSMKSLIGSLDALRQAGTPSGWKSHPNAGLIGTARNELTAQFLADPDASHLVFLDADIEWEPKDLLRLLGHNVEIVAAAYAFRDASAKPGFFEPRHTPSGEIVRDPDTGLIEILAAGAGFVSIRRSALLQIMKKRPDDRIVENKRLPVEARKWSFNFFPVSVDQFGRQLTEDVAFFARWRALGGKAWLDPMIRLKHYGSYAYEFDPMTLVGADTAISAAAA